MTDSESDLAMAQETRQVSLTQDATAMTIAGSDPSGGAGLQADLKAFQAGGVYGMAVVSLLTVQNTVGVDRVEVMPLDLIRQQIDAVLSDIHPMAIKTGALGNAKTIRGVAKQLGDYKGDLVVDPVLVSKHGDRLADDDSVTAYRDHLIPIATIVTPNKHEAELLLGKTLGDVDSMVEAVQDLQDLGAQYVLLKGGLIDGHRMHIFVGSEKVTTMAVPNHDTDQTHGAGCSLSAMLTAQLALTDPQPSRDEQVKKAVGAAMAAVHHAIGIAPGFGKGRGPIESRILHVTE